MSRFGNAVVSSICILLEWITPLLAVWLVLRSAAAGRPLWGDFWVYVVAWLVVYVLWALAVPYLGWPDRKPAANAMNPQRSKVSDRGDENHGRQEVAACQNECHGMTRIDEAK